jgi:hypothetical protein
MQGSHQRRRFLVRWLLAGWLVLLPWFTQSMPLDAPHDDSTVSAEMPCHGHGEIAGMATEPAAPECPHCTGDGLATCKCCSFAAPAAIPAVEVSVYSHLSASPTLIAAGVGAPPRNRHEQLYRPPIRS